MYDELIQDLRNKYSRIYSYFQIKETNDESLIEVQNALEETLFEDNERFVKLLKQEV
jgi:hypothetical protein